MYMKYIIINTCEHLFIYR